jgi:limonene-1,2-epoxide hydrolase
MTERTSSARVATIVGWLDAMRRADLDQALDYFAPDVTWQGLAPGIECSDVDEVRTILKGRIHSDIDVQRVEIAADTDQVVLGIWSRDLKDLAGAELDGQLFSAFRIKEGKIVAVRDYGARPRP